MEIDLDNIVEVASKGFAALAGQRSKELGSPGLYFPDSEENIILSELTFVF